MSGPNANSTTVWTFASYPSEIWVEAAIGSPSGRTRQDRRAVRPDRLGDQLADGALGRRQREGQLRHARAPG